MRTAMLLMLPLVALAIGDPEHLAKWAKFKSEFKKVYSSVEEEDSRLQAFVGNLKLVEEQAASGMTTQGITKFSDLTPAEFKARYLTRKPSASLVNLPEWNGECTACKRFPGNDKLGNLTWDWTTKGAVTHVKNQGQCGSCWAFGTTGDIEGSWFLAGHNLTSLSEQQLVSCDASDSGCNGGLQENAFKYIIKNDGIVAESTYPYTSGHGYSNICHTQYLAPIAATISSWYRISHNKEGEAAMETALPQVGPITISINAAYGLQGYKKGIFDPFFCPGESFELDHAVLLVGSGIDNGVEYWKIKNSWAADWGEDGYFRIVKGSNKCGIATDAVHSKI